jgi:hypothetical protein
LNPIDKTTFLLVSKKPNSFLATFQRKDKSARGGEEGGWGGREKEREVRREKKE